MASEPQTPAQTIDYNFAREELMLNELSNDPIQTAIARLEKQHEEDKQGMSWVELSLVDRKLHKYAAVNLIENKLM